MSPPARVMSCRYNDAIRMTVRDRDGITVPEKLLYSAISPMRPLACSDTIILASYITIGRTSFYNTADDAASAPFGANPQLKISINIHTGQVYIINTGSIVYPNSPIN